MELSTEVVKNQGLFSDYYLENVFGDRPDIEGVFASADDALGRAMEIYAEEKRSLTGTKEGQTEQRFIRPILDQVLGWDFIVQETVQGQKSFGEPDYALFSEPETYRYASEEAAQGKRESVFRRATTLAEAKKWHQSLDGTEAPATNDGAPSQGTPGAQLLRYFQWTQVPWGLLTNGNLWRLYTTRVPSPVDTYLEFDLEGILEQPHGTAEDPTDARTAFRLFYTLFRAEAFREDPTFGRSFIESVFEESVEQGEALEDELTERVFDEVFLKLATGLYEDWCEEADAEIPSEEVLDEIYEATLRLLYRLLFLLYAEERDLLPVRDGKGYYRFSLTRIARDAREEVQENYVLVEDNLWEDLTRLFGIINTGKADLNVPTYNGLLFDVGTGDNAWLDRHTVPDKFLAPALTALTLMDPEDPDTRGVDYKALDVRQLGSIYEGLLEHRLRYAEEDRAVVRENGTEVYKPLTDVGKTPVEVVSEGDLYLETDQSERKKTGSYYTPHYVVEYIVENTLGPILDERIEEFEDAMADINAILEDHDLGDPGVEAQLDAPRRRARESLFSLRVCDPAMGSGHFLVHAVDYLTNRIGAVALERDWTVNPIREALDDIRADVLDNLDEQDVQLDDAEARLDDFTLLKRLVMKRCIYGVDLNPMAVELAKLSLWLRSFTVGAPLSFLNHHLKPGNSLIGTQVGEVRTALEAEEQQYEVFGGPFAGLLQATELMQEVARLSDATVEQVRESADHFNEYKDAMRPYKRILDLWVSRHFGNERADYLLRQFGNEVLDVFRGQGETSDAKQREALEAAVDLTKSKSFFHWELEFPEVYYDLDRCTRKQNPGFDAVIGNPPYGYRVTGDIDDYLEEAFGKANSENIAEYFVERCFVLLKKSANWGMIIPKQVLHTPTWNDVRRTIHGDSTSASTIVDVSEAFREVLLEQVVVLASEQKTDRVRIGKIKNGEIDDSYSIESQKLTDQLWPIYAFREFEEIYERVHSVADLLGNLADIYFGVKNIKSRLTKSDGIPMITGDNIMRYGIVGDPPCLPENEVREKWKEKYLIPKLVVQRIVAHVTKPHPHIVVMASNDKEGRLAFDTATVVRSNVENYSDDFLLAIINSRYTSWYLHRFVYNFSTRTMGFRDGFADKLPIREIGFTTPEDEREHHREEIVGTYDAERDRTVDPADSATLARAEDHLDADPERADVVHDLLAHLAREMTALKDEHQEVERAFDPFKYLPRHTASTTLSEAFAEGIKYGELSDSPVDVTSAQHNVEALRLAQSDGNWVLEARLKKRDPNDWQEWQKDNGNIVREWVPVLRFHTLDEQKARFYRFALPHLASFSNEDNDFSGTIIPGGYTRTVQERVWQTPVPVYDASVDLSDLVSLEREKQAKEREMAFTDGLIDQIVYRLYGLTDEEVAVVEGN